MKSTQIAVAAACILLATTACGGSPEPAAATDQPDRLLQQAPSDDREFPGANGEIAAIDGRTLQVQNPMEGQVAVTYTDKTAITAEVDAALSDLEVGDCVMVMGEGEDDIAATTVRITSAADDGSCAPGGPGGMQSLEGGPPPGISSGEMPEGMPDRAVAMTGAFGEVTAVAADSFTVETVMPGQDESTTRDVTASNDTTFTDTVDTTADALKVGKCVSVRGDRDETGAVTADSIAVAEPVEGQCMAGGILRMEAP